MRKWSWCIAAVICAALIAAPGYTYAQDEGYDEPYADAVGEGHAAGEIPSAGEEGQGEPGVRLYLDGREIYLTDPIQNMGGRTYLPLRSFCEILDAEVTWRQDLNSVDVVRGRKEAVFGVDSGFYTVNGIVNHMADATMYLDQSINRVYIPIRYGAETFGFIVEWVNENGAETVNILSTPASSGELTDNEITVAGRMVWLGQSETELIMSLGYPSRIDESAFGLQWFVYNRSYRDFIMVGMNNRRVSGFFCNSISMGLKGGLGYGADKQAVEDAGFSKETMELWFDPYAEDRLFAVFCMADFPGAASQQAVFEQNQELLLRAYEMECFDITNAFRVANDKPEVLYSAYAAKVALAYAKEMAEGNFLSHFNPSGADCMDRFEAQGIYADIVLENLAGGYSDAIHVMKGWVESESHREGMLEDNQYLGVGAFFKPATRYRYYFVQEFYTLN